MNLGLLLKSVRELAAMTAIIAILLGLIEGLITYVLATFQRQFSTQMLELPFVRSMVAAMVGADQGPGSLGADVFAGVPWVHPVVLAFLFGSVIVACTRTPAGEVDRGTIDVLMGMPVSRWRVYISDTLVWIAATVTIIAMVFVGNRVAGALIDPSMRVPAGRAAIVAVSLFALCLSVAGVSCLFSSMANRKGRAMAAAVAFALLSFLINYLAQIWKPAGDIGFLSVLNYHKPLEILHAGTGSAWPWRNLGVLLGVSLITWIAGGIAFARRDLSTL